MFLLMNIFLRLTFFFINEKLFDEYIEDIFAIRHLLLNYPNHILTSMINSYSVYNYLYPPVGFIFLAYSEYFLKFSVDIAVLKNEST